jgi:hypothetical protein
MCTSHLQKGCVIRCDGADEVFMGGRATACCGPLHKASVPVKPRVIKEHLVLLLNKDCCSQQDTSSYFVHTVLRKHLNMPTVEDQHAVCMIIQQIYATVSINLSLRARS